MLKKFLKEVVIIVVGKQAEGIADLLDSKKHVNEFVLAKKLDITINQTRNILYRLSDYGLVSSIRKKDKKKGWYTYFWKIEVLKTLEFLRSALEKRLEQIIFQIRSRETKQFYVCEKCNIEFNEENALLHDFTCNECGSVFTVKDNSKVLKELKKNEERILSEIKLIDDEIGKEKEKLEKVRLKEIEKVKKEKAEIRRVAAEKRKAEKKMVSKKVAASKVSKKISPKKHHEQARSKVSKKKNSASKKIKSGRK